MVRPAKTVVRTPYHAPRLHILLLCLLTFLATLLPCSATLAAQPAHPAAAAMSINMSQNNCHPCCRSQPSLSAPSLCCQTHPQPASPGLQITLTLAPPTIVLHLAVFSPTLHLANPITTSTTNPRPPLLTILRI